MELFLLVTFGTLCALLAEPTSADETKKAYMCYFSIGYGSFLKPCCLKEITFEEYRKSCGKVIFGGAVGKSCPIVVPNCQCPKDANEAQEKINEFGGCGKIVEEETKAVPCKNTRNRKVCHRALMKKRCHWKKFQRGCKATCRVCCGNIWREKKCNKNRFACNRQGRRGRRVKQKCRRTCALC